MTDETTGRASLARNVGVLVGGVVVVELVFASFLWVMAKMAAGASSSNTDEALVFGAVASAVAVVVALIVGASTRSTGARVSLATWTARVLPVVAAAVALVVAAFGGVPWLAVPLALFTTMPVSIVGMVAPQLLASRR